jgi:formylglycine-generating enzyme required for sulfatase activity
VFPVLEQFEWFCANSGETAHPVGTKAANPWGLKDVHGNVREWCWDWMTDYSSAEKTDYRGPSIGEFRSIRGGAFGQNLDVRNMRSASRNQSRPGLSWGAVGFRLVRSLH